MNAIKYEIGVSVGPGDTTRICHVSKAYPGSVADITISRECLLPKLMLDECVIMDKGYQDDNEPHFMSPVKLYGGRDLTLQELEYNRVLNKKRVIVENTNKRVKDFDCLSTPWRQHLRHELHEVCFTVVCLILNISFIDHPLRK